MGISGGWDVQCDNPRCARFFYGPNGVSNWPTFDQALSTVSRSSIWVRDKDKWFCCKECREAESNMTIKEKNKARFGDKRDWDEA